MSYEQLMGELDRLAPGLGPRLGRGADFRHGAGRVLFWMVLLFWLSGLVTYLPRFLAAVLILFAGVLGGHFLRDLVLSAAASAGSRTGPPWPDWVRWRSSW